MRILFILFMMLLMSPLRAETKVSGTELESARKKLDELEVFKRNVFKKVVDYSARMSEVEAEVKRVESEIDAKNGMLGLGGSKEEMKKLEEQLRKARHDKRDADVNLVPQLRVAQNQLKSVQEEIEQMRQSLSRGVRDAIELTDNLNQKVRAQGLQIDFMFLESKFENADQALNFIERIYDKSLVGAYFQDKIGQLLNSQVICEARKRCLTEGAKEIDPNTIQTELFPESKKIRSDYYDKVNKKAGQAK